MLDNPIAQAAIHPNADHVPNTTIFETAVETPTIGGKAPVRYGYARVSTDDQNLNLQLDALNAASVTHIFTDKLSGKTRKRPGLEDLLSQIGPNDTLVVWRLDRIGRNFRDLVDIADELRERGANLVSLSEGIDTSSSIGEVIYRLMIVFADFERKVIVERTNAGLEAAKARGVKLGRRRKLSKTKLSELKIAVAQGLSKQSVAEKFNIGRTTLYRCLNLPNSNL